MNVPGTAEGNWEWRVTEGALTQDIAARLRQYAERYGRFPMPSTSENSPQLP
jgi:4-alpha-glucanotransferase